MDHFAEQTPRAEQNEDADDHTQDGVRKRPPESPDENA
jgi:hypothetical protein